MMADCCRGGRTTHLVVDWAGAARCGHPCGHGIRSPCSQSGFGQQAGPDICEPSNRRDSCWSVAVEVAATSSGFALAGGTRGRRVGRTTASTVGTGRCRTWVDVPGANSRAVGAVAPEGHWSGRGSCGRSRWSPVRACARDGEDHRDEAAVWHDKGSSWHVRRPGLRAAGDTRCARGGQGYRCRCCSLCTAVIRAVSV